jgi:hypothetical protein
MRKEKKGDEEKKRKFPFLEKDFLKDVDLHLEGFSRPPCIGPDKNQQQTRDWFIVSPSVQGCYLR